MTLGASAALYSEFEDVRELVAGYRRDPLTLTD